MDIVIPVKPGRQHEELRYALRAIDAHVPHDRVWIVGHKPDWCDGVEHIDVERQANKYANVRHARRLAAEHPDVSDDFAWFNDDFHVVRPIDSIPVLNRGPLADVIDIYQRRQGGSSYTRGMRATADLLRKWGHNDPLSFELHVPMVFNKAATLDLLDRIPSGITVPHVRTLYGAVMGLTGETIEDVKVYTKDQPLPRGPWLSSYDSMFQYGVGNVVRWLFPDPCRYERAEVVERVA